MSDNAFKVNSSDHKQVYTVQIKEATCSIPSCCIPQCTFSKCGHLRRHRIECTCYDYTHGHLCKHVHKVNMLLEGRQPEEDLSISMPEHDQLDIVCNVSSPRKQASTGIVRLTFYILPLDLNAQKKQIEHYLGQIQNAIKQTEECDIT